MRPSPARREPFAAITKYAGTLSACAFFRRRALSAQAFCPPALSAAAHSFRRNAASFAHAAGFVWPSAAGVALTQPEWVSRN